jgi:sugar/nucleoside kinase (ribokinase family)
MPLELALRRATIAGTLAVTKIGAYPSIPYLVDILSLIDK